MQAKKTAWKNVFGWQHRQYEDAILEFGVKYYTTFVWGKKHFNQKIDPWIMINRQHQKFY